MRIIDETYNGAKYPIIEREYNAYYFPDNYNPDNIPQQADSVADAYEHHYITKIYHRANPR
jgi:hypothetical protein